MAKFIVKGEVIQGTFAELMNKTAPWVDQYYASRISISTPHAVGFNNISDADIFDSREEAQKLIDIAIRGIIHTRNFRIIEIN